MGHSSSLFGRQRAVFQAFKEGAEASRRALWILGISYAYDIVGFDFRNRVPRGGYLS